MRKMASDTRRSNSARVMTGAGKAGRAGGSHFLGAFRLEPLACLAFALAPRDSRWTARGSRIRRPRGSRRGAGSWGGTRGGRAGSGRRRRASTSPAAGGRTAVSPPPPVVALRDADPVGHAQHVAIDGSPGTPSACPSTTFAVLRPTPGSFVSASMSAGTSPRCSRIRICAIVTSAFDFCRKKPVERICGSSSSGVAAASAFAFGLAREERRRDHVHARVGRLRRQHRGDEQLERVAVAHARYRRRDRGRPALR